MWSDTFSLILLPPHTFSLLQLGTPPTEYPNKGPFHRLPFFMNWYCMGLFHGIQSFREWNAHIWISHRVAGPYRNPASAWVPLFMGHKPSQRPPPAWASPGAAFFHGCSGMKASQTTVWISLPLWASMSCRGSTCVTIVFTTGSGEKLFSSSVSTSFPHLLWPWCCQSFFSHIYSVLSALQCCFTLLKCVITEVLPLSLMCSALASGMSILESAGNVSVQHTDNFWCLLTKATSEAPQCQNVATWSEHSNILKTHILSMILRKYT